MAGGVTTYYIGNYYEWRVETGGSTGVEYYYAGSQRVAMRVGTALSYLFGDHLGSNSITADASGNVSGELRYLPFGETRYTSGQTPTSFRYTAQREDSTINLYWYNSRWYDAYLNRWIQPDSVIPDPDNPIDWDHYAYVRNNPLKYIDDDGHNPLLIIALIGAAIFFSQIPSDQYQTDPARRGDAGVMAFGAVLMTAPALGPLLCSNDGNCFNEAETVNNLTQSLDLDQDGTPLNEVETSINAGQRTINFLSEQLRKVNHIMKPEHAWDRLTNLSGNVSEDYEAIQPYIQQAVDIGTETQINTTAQGNAVMRYIATINGETIVVDGVKYLDGVFQIGDAWVQTE